MVKHAAEHLKTYLMSVLVLVGVLLLGGGFLVYMLEAPFEVGMQYAMYSAIYFLAGAMFTSTVFADYGDPKKTISALTLPASNFEKYLVGWLVSYIIFTFVYTGVFYSILLILINLQHQPNPPREILNLFNGQQLMIFVLFTLLHSISIFGAIFFKKLHFIKTAFSFFILIALVTLVNTFFLQEILGQRVRPAIPFGNVDFVAYNAPRIFGARETSFMVVYLILFISAVFWVASYFRLKEKQA